MVLCSGVAGSGVAGRWDGSADVCAGRMCCSAGIGWVFEFGDIDGGAAADHHNSSCPDVHHDADVGGSIGRRSDLSFADGGGADLGCTDVRESRYLPQRIAIGNRLR